MALIVNSVKFPNTDLALTNVYVRLQYTALADGKSIVVNLTCFESKIKFDELKPLTMNFPNNFRVECGIGQEQNLLVAHELSKNYLENIQGMNYSVTIDLT